MTQQVTWNDVTHTDCDYPENTLVNSSLDDFSAKFPEVMNAICHTKGPFFRVGFRVPQIFEQDVSSIYPSIRFDLEGDLSTHHHPKIPRAREFLDIVEHDIYVNIPPTSHRVELYIDNIRKGKPVIVHPDEYK